MPIDRLGESVFRERIEPGAIVADKRKIAGTAPASLLELPADGRGIVAKLKGGTAFVSRLAALGFTTGAEVTVVRNSGHGPLIVSLRGTTIALGRGEAAKVMVAGPADGLS